MVAALLGAIFNRFTEGFGLLGLRVVVDGRRSAVVRLMRA